MSRWLESRTARILIIVTSAVAFALAGLLWVRLTGQWGASYPHCTGPPGLVACTKPHPPSWAWRILGMTFGGFFGFILAVAALKIAEVNEMRKHHSGSEPTH
jgi:hypothetical protein